MDPCDEWHTLLFQFYIWMGQDAVQKSAREMIRGLWNVISYPFFHLFSTDFNTQYFWPVFLANDLLWGSIIGSMLYLILRAKDRLARPLHPF